MNDHRVGIAAALSPLFPGVAFAVLLSFFGGPPTPLSLILLIFLFALPVSYLGFALFGLPLLFFLRKRGTLSFAPFLAAGLVGGTVMFQAFALLLSWLLESPYRFGLDQIAWGAGLGLSVAAVFCLLAGITSGSSGRPRFAGLPSPTARRR